jgi:hypothetical protein
MDIKEEALFKAILERLRTISALRGQRQSLNSELALLPENSTRLVLKGLNIKDEHARISAQIADCDSKIADAIEVARRYWQRRVTEMHNRAESLSRDFILAPRAELKRLLQQAASIVEAAGKVSPEIEALRRELSEIRGAIVHETNENPGAYPIGEVNAPLTLPTIRREDINNDVLALKSIAEQIS